MYTTTSTNTSTNNSTNTNTDTITTTRKVNSPSLAQPGTARHGTGRHGTAPGGGCSAPQLAMAQVLVLADEGIGVAVVLSNGYCQSRWRTVYGMGA